MKVTTSIQVKFQAEWANPYVYYLSEEMIDHYLADPESLWFETRILGIKGTAEMEAVKYQIQHGDSMDTNLGKVSVKIRMEFAPDGPKPGHYVSATHTVQLQLDEGDLACRDPKNSAARKFLVDTRRFFLRPRQGFPA